MRNRVHISAQALVTISLSDFTGPEDFNGKFAFYIEKDILFVSDDAARDCLRILNLRTHAIAGLSRPDLLPVIPSVIIDLLRPTDDEIAEVEQLFDMLQDILPYDQEPSHGLRM